MRRLAFGIAALSTLAWATPADDFQAATQFSFGAGSTLAPAYATADMSVTLRIRFGFVWVPSTQTGSITEAPYTKTAGQLGFVLNTSAINPLLPPWMINVAGVRSGNQVDWSFDQTFSQTGGWNINTTVDINGTPTAVNVTVNNVRNSGHIRSIFGSVTPFWNSVLASNSAVRGTYSGGDAQNYIDVSAGSVTGTVGGVPVNGMEVHVLNLQHIMHVPFTPTVAGTIQLQDMAVPSSHAVNWTLLDGSNNVAASGSFPGTSAAYTIHPNVPVGSYNLVMVGRTHLAKSIPVTIGTAPAAANFSLKNGDVDHDNEVGLSDFGLMSNAFGTFEGDAGFNQFADLDNDGEVGLSDFGILSQNFGELGD